MLPVTILWLLRTPTKIERNEYGFERNLCKMIGIQKTIEYSWIVFCEQEYRKQL